MLPDRGMTGGMLKTRCEKWVDVVVDPKLPEPDPNVRPEVIGGFVPPLGVSLSSLERNEHMPTVLPYDYVVSCVCGRPCSECGRSVEEMLEAGKRREFFSCCSFGGTEWDPSCENCHAGTVTHRLVFSVPTNVAPGSHIGLSGVDYDWLNNSYFNEDGLLLVRVFHAEESWYQRLRSRLWWMLVGRRHRDKPPVAIARR